MEKVQGFPVLLVKKPSQPMLRRQREEIVARIISRRVGSRRQMPFREKFHDLT